MVTVILVSIFKRTQVHSTLRETVKNGWIRRSDELVWSMGSVVPWVVKTNCLLLGDFKRKGARFE